MRACSLGARGGKSALLLSPLAGQRHSIRSAVRAMAQSADRRSTPVVIAVDGPAASGKGTLAKQLASALHLEYLDTGLLYRAVARQALHTDVPLNAESDLAQVAQNLTPQDLSETHAPDLRTERVGSAASVVSVLPAVRQAVNLVPRTLMEKLPDGVLGCVMDGRDVGTVIFPNAQVKLYLTASAEVRAQRRLLELRGRGDHTTTYDDVLASVKQRDERDTARATAPLKPADDAHVLDTSNMDQRQTLDWAMNMVKQKCPQLMTITAT